MTLNFFCTFLAFAFPLLLGWNFLNIVDRGQRGRFFCLEKLFISFGLGMGLLTLTMFYMSLLRIHFSFAGISLLAALPIAIFAFIYPTLKKNINPKEDFFFRLKHDISQWKIYEMILLLIIIFAIGSLFFRTFIIEADKWDSWAVWCFKAKVYFVERIIPFHKFLQFKSVWGNWDYPQHVPLMETWVFLSLGQFNDQIVRVIFPIYHLGLVVCLYAYFRRSLIRSVSLCGAFFIATLPILNIVTVGTYAEPVLLFYYILSFRFLLEWKDLEDNKYLFLAALFCGLAAWTKNEGIVYSFFNLIIIILMTKDKPFLQRAKFVLVFSGSVGLIICPWLYVKSTLGLENILINPEHLAISYLVKSSMNFKNVVVYWIKNCVGWDSLNLFRIMFLSYLILNWKTIWKSLQRYVMLSISFHILLSVILFFILPTEQYLREVFNRLLIAPSILIIMLVFYSGDSCRDS